MARRIPVREILRLRASGLSATVIARTQPVSKTSVVDTFHAADERGVAWEDVEGMSDAEGHTRCCSPRGVHEGGPSTATPTGTACTASSPGSGVTLKRLHEEYRDDARSKGEPFMSYDRFCKRYREFTVRKQVVRPGRAQGRAHHGGRLGRADDAARRSRDGRGLQGLPVRGLPALQPMSYVEPTLDMKQDTMRPLPRARVRLPRRLDALHRARQPEDRGREPSPRGRGRAQRRVPEMAAHYGSAVMPARVATPRDKPSAENEVWQAALEIIAAQRRHRVHRLQRAQEGRGGATGGATTRGPSPSARGTRREVFEEQERPLLRPLPAVPYEVCEWVYGRKVQRNCHVAYKRNYYSVSHLAVGRTVDLRVTDSTVEVFLGGRAARHASAVPGLRPNRYSTHAGDLPAGRSYSIGTPGA